jgi:DNA-binding ferritin-like protein (Dps family)
MTMFLKKMVDEKRQYRQYRARKEDLPDDYRAAVDAVERYLMYFGAITRGDILVYMLNDLADLFEQSVADGTPIRGIVGDDPVEFAETFLQNYAEGQWIITERQRLTTAIDLAAGDRPNVEKMDA